MKENPCVIATNNNLELEMTQVITNCQKHEFYPKMKWTFDIQANLDTMNQLSWHIIKYINSLASFVHFVATETPWAHTQWL